MLNSFNCLQEHAFLCSEASIRAVCSLVDVLVAETRCSGDINTETRVQEHAIQKQPCMLCYIGHSQGMAFRLIFFAILWRNSPNPSNPMSDRGLQSSELRRLWCFCTSYFDRSICCGRRRTSLILRLSQTVVVEGDKRQTVLVCCRTISGRPSGHWAGAPWGVLTYSAHLRKRKGTIHETHQ
ncbi:hypothetical protein KP509_38G033700 [Ceratopteris richardii]|uniref:Uncharacterized protein n=1 Tax=Ceratopteris richardii TaxID=49495 RepID=A0A8T2Q3T0_CERRI|nr:hypothetical protein KP509_38G033700 [Ceratopteris richardii]